MMVPALLRGRVFRRYWSASTISMFGDQISGVALPLAAVLALHAGAAQMGYLTALEWLPSLLFGLHAGAWVDRRGRRRRTMIAADAGRAALFASIPVCYALAARIGAGWAYAAGCLLYAAPLVLWPLAHGAMPLVLAMLVAAEFVSGFGLMVLDITIGVIFAAIIPNTLRSRVTGAFQAVNYGTRPLGALLGGVLGSALGLRPALWVATLGGVAGFALLLPTPLPRYRLPVVDGPARA
jgi:MFS family permease